MENVVTAISQNGGAVVHVVDSTAIVAEMEQLHKTAATASAALGRLLTAAALMGTMLKSDDDSITLKIKGGGTAGTLTAVCDAHGNVRGMMDNPLADMPLNPNNGKLNVGGIVGNDGTLIVMRDNGSKEPYIGQVRLVSGEIAEDITSYFAHSEQTPSVCALGVLVNPQLTIKAAGGYLLQLMPGATDDEISLIENNIAKLDAVTTMIDSGVSPHEIAFAVLDGFKPELLHTGSARYQCNCSADKMKRALISIGKTDLYALAEEQPETEIMCHYCNKAYRFTSAQMKDLATN